MELKELCWRLNAAKADEQAAKTERIRLEHLIVHALNIDKMEGVTTTATDGYKIAVKTKVNRKLDYEAYQRLALPPNLAFVDLKPEINLTALRAIERIDPALAAACVTITPGKPEVKVEEVF